MSPHRSIGKVMKLKCTPSDQAKWEKRFVDRRSQIFCFLGRAGPQHASNEMPGSSRSVPSQIFSSAYRLVAKKSLEKLARANLKNYFYKEEMADLETHILKTLKNKLREGLTLV